MNFDPTTLYGIPQAISSWKTLTNIDSTKEVSKLLYSLSVDRLTSYREGGLRNCFCLFEESDLEGPLSMFKFHFSKSSLRNCLRVVRSIQPTVFVMKDIFCQKTPFSKNVFLTKSSLLFEVSVLKFSPKDSAPSSLLLLCPVWLFSKEEGTLFF